MNGSGKQGCFQKMVTCTCQNRDRKCICIALKPLVKTFQLTGIFPVTYHCDTCEVSHSWTSVSAFISWFWFGLNITLFTCVFAFASIFVSSFTGTDFYTFSLVILAHFVATTFVFYVANFKAKNFCKAFELLHGVVQDLNINEFAYVKRLIYSIPLYIFLDASTMMIPMCLEQDPLRKTPPALAFFITFVGNIVPNLVTSSFAILLGIIGVYFDRINDRVKDIFLKTEEADSHWTLHKDQNAREVKALAQFCYIHEKLCICVRQLCVAFGPQMFLIFGCILLRFISGIYVVTIALTGLSDKPNAFTVHHFLTSALAGLRIVIVLTSSQQVIEKSNEPTGTLLRALGPNNSNGMRSEITTFLDKIGKFPLEIDCCGIHKLDPSYMAGAIPSIITHVLVLMQFKQADTQDQ